MPRFLLSLFACWLLNAGIVGAAPRAHLISFGKWTTVKCNSGSSESKAIDLLVRALVVDARVKEYAIGQSHDITDRLFVVQRAFRLNDNLPEERGPTRWQWERGGWLLVDRVTGRISPIGLPEFDAAASVASWYRDYVAYCGVTEDGRKLYAMVMQLGRRKPLLKNLLEDARTGDTPDSFCPAPVWQRQPARVIFDLPGGQKTTYSVRGSVVDIFAAADSPDDNPE